MNKFDKIFLKVFIVVGVILVLVPFLAATHNLPFEPYGQYCAIAFSVYVLLVVILLVIRN
jgi:hypothetical protein